MHPKRLFALCYTAGLVCLLWVGIQRAPEALNNWWFTDWSIDTPEECQRTLADEYNRTHVINDVPVTAEDKAWFVEAMRRCSECGTKGWGR